MKHLLFFMVLLSTFFSCKRENYQIIQGNLYIKLIHVHNVIHGMPEEKIEKFKETIFNTNQGEYSNSEKLFMQYHKILIERNLYNQPHFKLKLDDKIINVYTNESEYLKLQKELKNLDKEKEKIIIKFEGFKISDGLNDPDEIFSQPIYKALGIISVKKIKGQTDWDK